MLCHCSRNEAAAFCRGDMDSRSTRKADKTTHPVLRAFVGISKNLENLGRGLECDDRLGRIRIEIGRRGV
jgi:hypothetical protein